MNTTINRQGEVKQLSYKEGQQSAVVAFKGGYVKFFFTEQDIPDGLMLKDKVEVSLIINNND